MSGIVTMGEVAAAAGDAYGAYQGGMSTPTNQASFGAAVASGAAARWAGPPAPPPAPSTRTGCGPATRRWGCPGAAAAPW